MRWLARVLVAGATVLTATIGVPLAVAVHAQPVVPAPTLTLTPASGPVGTHVTIGGHLTTEQVAAYKQHFVYRGYFDLETDFEASCTGSPAGSHCIVGPRSLNGCELLAYLNNGTVHLEPTSGKVTGSFTVPPTGSCFQSQPDNHAHPVVPGIYGLVLGSHAFGVASFVVTAPTSPVLPFTGFPLPLALVAASALIGSGFLLRRLAVGHRP